MSAQAVFGRPLLGLVLAGVGLVWIPAPSISPGWAVCPVTFASSGRTFASTLR
jgi:hypothetical protein